MSKEFALSKDLRQYYNELSYDEKAEFSCVYIPLGSIIWKDEHPKGRLPRKADSQSEDTIYTLIEARRYYWENGKPPPDLEIFWIQAKSEIPNWPGFQRLNITKDEYEQVLQCERASKEMLIGLASMADEFSIDKSSDGKMGFSATFDLSKEDSSKKWWQFWK